MHPFLWTVKYLCWQPSPPPPSPPSALHFTNCLSFKTQPMMKVIWKHFHELLSFPSLFTLLFLLWFEPELLKEAMLKFCSDTLKIANLSTHPTLPYKYRSTLTGSGYQLGSSNMASRGWLLLLALILGLSDCYGKKKVSKEVRNFLKWKKAKKDHPSYQIFRKRLTQMLDSVDRICGLPVNNLLSLTDAALSPWQKAIE